VAEPILVVVPTRDRPAYLAEAVACVLGQDDRDLRCVVADDGTEHPAQATLSGWLEADPRLTLVLAHAGSPGGARAAGIAHGVAQSIDLGRPPPALVAFLDDDDLWRPDHLVRARAALAAAPDAPFVHAAARTQWPDGHETPWQDRDSGPFHGPELFRRLLRRDLVATSSVVARRAAYDAVGGFRVDQRLGEDWDLWLRLSHRSSPAFVEAPTVICRRHATNTTGGDALASLRLMSAVLEGWRARREELTAPERRILRAELSRRYARETRLGLRDAREPRAEVRVRAWRRFGSLPAARTLGAALRATLLPRG